MVTEVQLRTDGIPIGPGEELAWADWEDEPVRDRDGYLDADSGE